jgi:hypothetical protein
MTIFKKDANTPNMEFSNDSNGRTLKHKIVYYTDDISEGVEYRMGTWSGIPQKGDAYQYDPNLVVSSVRCSPIDNSDEDGSFVYWYAEITYTPLSDEPNGGSDRWQDVPDRISWSGAQYEEVVEKAYAVNGVSTVANGQPIGAIESTTREAIPATKFISNSFVTITTNQADFNPDWISEYENTVISKTSRIAGTGVDKGQARMLRINASNQVDGSGQDYYEITIEIEINKQGFNLKPMNRGFYKKDPDTAEPTARLLILKKDISNETGDIGDERIEEPWKLDANSNPILDETAYYLDFQVMQESPWSSLPIPSNF